MKEVTFMKRAENAIYKVAKEIADQNLPDTGEKFINEVIDLCIGHAKVSIKYPLCKNKILAKHHFHCIVFKKKWIIAFRVTKKEFVVYRFIYGPRLR
jgi:hypothetical protein